MTVLDMTNPETRARVRVVSAYYALRLEINTGLKASRVSVFKTMQRDGFKANTKKAMACVLYEWLGQHNGRPVGLCVTCGGNHGYTPPEGGRDV